MGWDPLHLPLGAIAVGTVVVAVLLYGIAPRLPPPFPSVMRLVCIWLVITSTTLLVIIDETWWHAAALGGAGLVAVIGVYLLQTRRKTTPVMEANTGKEAESTAVGEPAP